MENLIDDGGLDCLGIPTDESNRSFNCCETTQQKLINTTFWVTDIIENVTTKHGDGRMIVKIKNNKEDKEAGIINGIYLLKNTNKNYARGSDGPSIATQIIY